MKQKEEDLLTAKVVLISCLTAAATTIWMELIGAAGIVCVTAAAIAILLRRYLYGKR